MTQNEAGWANYTKRPVVIQAIRWTGDNEDEVAAFTGGAALFGMDEPLGTARIPTLEGVMTAWRGDWIIRGVKGEYYPCRPDIFEATYERTARDG